MAQQIINDSPANSGLGDPLKVAFDKVNANFTELYTPVARTAAEISAGVTPSNFGYAPGNVLRYGADPTGVADSATAITSAASSYKDVIFPQGSYLLNSSPSTGQSVMQYAKGATFSGTGAASLLLAANAGDQFIQENTAGTDFATRCIRRQANHTGGTPGNTSAGLRVDTYASSGVANFEWALVGTITNSATGGQNVGVVGYGFKTAVGVGPTFGGNIGVFETTAFNNPTAGSVGLEVDNFSNGTDSNGSRVILDCFAYRQNAAGPATTCSWGVRVSNNRDGTNTSIGTAFFVGNANASTCPVQVAFDCGSATISIAALRMPSGAAILFDNPGSNQLSYDGTGLLYKVGANSASRLNADGSISLGGTGLPMKIAGTFSTGAATPVLTANKPGASTAIQTWADVVINGTAYTFPLWAKA